MSSKEHCTWNNLNFVNRYVVYVDESECTLGDWMQKKLLFFNKRKMFLQFVQRSNFIRDTLQNALGTCRLTIQNYKVSCTSLLINEKVKITFLNGDFYIDLSLIKSWWLKCWTKNNNVKHFLFDLPHLGKWTTTVFIDTHNKTSVTSFISVGLFLYPFLRLIQICFLFVENVYIYCCSSSYVYCEIINDGKTRISRTTREK